MVHDKAPSVKEDLLTAIQVSWNHFDKEYCFKRPEVIMAVTKAQERTIKY